MYIKDTDIGKNYLKIDGDYKQIFENAFSLNIAQTEIVKMRDNDTLKDRDLAIAEFLFKFTFATTQQIYRYLNEDVSRSNIENRLNKLVSYRVLNRFILSSDNTNDKIESDALVIYCLDLGGRHLLENYSNLQTNNWYSYFNMKSSQNISKSLVTTEFYLRLKETCGDKVVEFVANPKLRVGKTNIIPAYQLCISSNGMKKYFIGEIARDDEIPSVFRERLDGLESLLNTQAWKKYFYDSDLFPSIFIFTSTDNMALECSKMLSAVFDNEDCKNHVLFRLSTQNRIQKVLYEAGSFLKYLPEKNALQETKATTFKS